MYIFRLELGLFYGVLPKKYWRNLCRLVCGICQAHQSKHQFLLDFVIEFEQLYYQHLGCQLHFVCPCVHLLTHIASKVHRVGPGIVTSQWTMERAIGNLGHEIHQPSNPYANLSHRAVL